MKSLSLWAAVGTVLIANVFALLHARSNRTETAMTDIVLTQREVQRPFSDSEDSGVTLNLQWNRADMSWLDAPALGELGFDTSMAPSDHRAQEFYSRQRARRAFIALEYDGPAWRGWLEREPRSYDDPREITTHLMAIDSASDPVRLRARHPDRSSVIIVPAVTSIFVNTPYEDHHRKPPRLSGAIVDIPLSIHVPLPFSEILHRQMADDKDAKYAIHLRYGASYEPWITAIDLPAPANPIR